MHALNRWRRHTCHDCQCKRARQLHITHEGLQVKPMPELRKIHALNRTALNSSFPMSATLEPVLTLYWLLITHCSAAANLCRHLVCDRQLQEQSRSCNSLTAMLQLEGRCKNTPDAYSLWLPQGAQQKRLYCGQSLLHLQSKPIPPDTLENYSMWHFS